MPYYDTTYAQQPWRSFAQIREHRVLKFERLTTKTYLALQVFTPIIEYNGHTPTKEVSRKIPATKSSTIPKVPVTVPVK